MRIKLNIDTQELQSKPATFDGRLRNRLCSADSIREVTPEQLIQAVQRGRSFTPAIMTGTTGDTWQAQQVICADIDNDTGKKDADGHKIRLADPLTPEKAREVMAQYGIDPYFMYYSFSNSDNWPKFRIVLILDKPITDPDTANDLITRFTGIFNKAVYHCADTTASDNARLYYGGKADCIIYQSGRTTGTELLQALPVYEDKQATETPTEAIKTQWEYKTTSPAKGAYKPYSALQAQFETDKRSFDLAAYVERTTNSRLVTIGRAQFFNPCPICGHNNDFQVTGSIYHCHSANGGTGGSIIDYLMNKDGLDIGAACDKFKYDIMGYDREEWRAAYIAENGEMRQPDAQNTQNGQNVQATEGAEDKPDFTDYYKSCKGHITDPEAQEYLSFRGISPGTAAAYYLGYDPETGFLIIPAARSFYIAMNTDRTAQERYRNPENVPTELFNKSALYNEAERPVFITEGAIDALSIIEAGGEAVALNGSGNTRKLLAEFDVKRTNNTLIVVQGTDELIKGLKDRGISFLQADICGQHKDPNDALTADKKAFIEAVAAAERGTNKPDNTADYIRRSMAAEIESLRAQSDRKTGFPNLDAEAGSIYAGLYAVGGISSVGKTTFISQITDQMASQGQHVLFFSMEQSRLEMVSKSISRNTAKDDPDKAVNSLQIRTGAKGDIITRATEKYLQSVGDRVSIIEGNLDCTVSFIGNYTRKYIAKNGGVKPIIVIDYLQVLRAEKDPETGRKMTDTKMIVDHNVTELRRLSRSLELPIFVISSVNRSNYLTPIDFEAFKESGGIEFTADVVWGLQLSAIHDPIFEKEGKIKEKREKIAEAKEAMPRDIELVCLKNRFGKSRYAVEFTYYPQYDYFVPQSMDGFTRAYTPTPFDK